MLAVPGWIDEPASAGTNALIAVGARPIVSDASFEAALAEEGLRGLSCTTVVQGG